MTNWKTTLIGALLAAAYVLQDTLLKGALLTDWTTWIVPVLIGALGYFAKDAGVSGTAKAIALFATLSCLLPSCTAMMGPTGKPTFRVDGVALSEFINTWLAQNDAKDANVIMVPSPKGDTLVATKPNGTVITEVISPSQVIVPNIVPATK